MIIKNIQAPGRALRAVLGVACLAMVARDGWQGGYSLLLVLVGVVSVVQAAVGM